MLEEEEDEQRLENSIKEAIIQGYIKETLSIWELCYVGLEITQLQEGKPASGPLRALSPQLLGATIAVSEIPGGFNL
jgi:hypothetical protein